MGTLPFGVRACVQQVVRSPTINLSTMWGRGPRDDSARALTEAYNRSVGRS
jgi:hypothetical protein